MQKKLMFLLAILVLPLISSSIVDGDCPSGETCMFSIYSLSDAHVGECGFFNYSVCYPGLLNITLRDGSCNAGENFILSFFKPNNTHISTQQGFYNYSLCVEGTTCEIGTSCYREHKIISINKEENSHVGEYLYYELGLCCGQVVKGISGAPGVTPVSVPEVIVETKEIIEEVTFGLKSFIDKIPGKIKEAYDFLKSKIFYLGSLISPQSKERGVIILLIVLLCGGLIAFRYIDYFEIKSDKMRKKDKTKKFKYPDNV